MSHPPTQSYVLLPSKELSVEQGERKEIPTALPLALGSMTGKAAHYLKPKNWSHWEGEGQKQWDCVFWRLYLCVLLDCSCFAHEVISLTLKSVDTVLLCWPPVVLFSSVASSSTYSGNVTESTVCENTEVIMLQKPWTSVTSFCSNPTSSVHSAKFQTL